jgi:hypothetical protein
MKRLFKSGIVTTILGVGTLSIGVWLYVSKDHNAVEAGAVCTIALVLLRSKDSLIGLKPKED